jgi:hypothetical protein
MPYYTVSITVQYTTERGKRKQSTWEADLMSGINSPFEFQCSKYSTPALYRAEGFDFTIKMYGSTYHMISTGVIPDEEVESDLEEPSDGVEKVLPYVWRKELTDSRIASKTENHKAQFLCETGKDIRESQEILLKDGLPFPFNDFLDAQFTYEILQQSQYFNFIVQVDGNTYSLETITPADDAPDTCPYM